MARIGFRCGTYCPKKNLTGVGKEAKNIIERVVRLDRDNEYMLLEKDRLGVGIPADTAAIMQDSEVMLPLQCLSNGIDLVHSFDDPCLNFCRNSTKKVLTVNDLIPAKYPQWFGDSPDTARKVEKTRESAAAADKIIAISEHTKRDIVECFDIPPDKIQVIYDGLDSALDAKAYSGDITSKQFGLRSRYIVSVCTIEPRKNLLGLVRAFAAYKRAHKGDELQLVVVGRTGWQTEEFFGNLQDSEYRKDIIVTGYVTDAQLLSLYKNALFVAYVSYYEGFGLPILEGLALGKTVLTSDTSSMPEVGGDAVCYCNPYETENIVAGIEQLAEDEQYRAGLEAKAYAQAAKFSYDTAAEQTLALYRELLA